MQFYYYIFMAIALLIVVLSLRYFIREKKNVPARLFAEALKNENSGHLAEAVITYKYALHEVRKVRFHSGLENKIVQKLKVLNTVMEYTHDSHFSR